MQPTGPKILLGDTKIRLTDGIQKRKKSMITTRKTEPDTIRISRETTVLLR